MRLNVVLQASCNRAKALRMTSEASMFFELGAPAVHPVPACTISWRYLFPQMSALLSGPVVSEDKTSRGA